MHGSQLPAARAAPEPDAHQRRVWRWPAKYLRGEPKLAWSILYQRNGFRLGVYYEHVTAAYFGNLYNAGDPRDAGQTVLDNLRRVHLVRCRALGKTIELELCDTEEAFRRWQLELGVTIADPQAAFPFTEEPPAEDEERSPSALTSTGVQDHAGLVAHDWPRAQGSPLLGGFASGGIPPARDIPRDIPGEIPPRARSSSSKKVNTTLIPHSHEAQRSSVARTALNENERSCLQKPKRDIPGDIPARGVAAIGDVAGSALAHLLSSDEAWDEQQRRRREQLAATLRGLIDDEAFFASELDLYAGLVVEGRLRLQLIESVVREINAFENPPRSRGAVFNSLMAKHCQKLGINLKQVRKGYG